MSDRVPKYVNQFAQFDDAPGSAHFPSGPAVCAQHGKLALLHYIERGRLPRENNNPEQRRHALRHWMYVASLCRIFRNEVEVFLSTLGEDACSVSVPGDAIRGCLSSN